MQRVAVETDQIGRIYIITNDINDKVYVGQTVQSLHKRFINHCCNSSKDNSKNMYIKRAILKYGKQHFKISLIEECPRELLNNREIYWITYYNSFNNGYNLTIGGNSNREVLTKSISSMINIEEFNNYVTSNVCTIPELVEKFSISRSSVYNLLKQLNKENTKVVKSKTRLSATETYSNEICKKYLEGYNIQDLITMFHSNKKYISMLLRKAEIKIIRNKKSMLEKSEYNTAKSVQTLASKVEG